MQIAGKLDSNPQDIAQSILEKLEITPQILVRLVVFVTPEPDASMEG